MFLCHSNEGWMNKDKLKTCPFGTWFAGAYDIDYYPHPRPPDHPGTFLTTFHRSSFTISQSQSECVMR